MKFALSPDVRIKLAENSNARAKIKQEIADRINAEYHDEAKSLLMESDSLYKEEKKFRDNAWDHLHKAYLHGTLVNIETQTGADSTRIRKYTGKVVQVSSSIFNFVDPNYLNGKEFSVGISCFLSIEPVEE